MTGHTNRPIFRSRTRCPPTAFCEGLANAFVSKLSFDERTSTLSMAYSTYLGGGAYDIGSGIAVDARATLT